MISRVIMREYSGDLVGHSRLSKCPVQISLGLGVFRAASEIRVNVTVD